jgi:hypothetical protein
MLLPLRYNDGRDIETDIFGQTWDELIAHFGAISERPGSIQGAWVYEGQRYEDDLLCWFVDADDTDETRQFFADYKAVLLQRFQQIEMYIISYPIERH